MINANRIISSLLIGSMLLAPGCAKQYVAKVAAFEPSQQTSVVEQAPRTGSYSLQFIAQKHYLNTPLYASDRWVQRGEPLGFKKNADGTVVALCGTEQIPVPALPARATHVMWYHKAKVPTHFGKEVDKALKSTGEALTVVATGVGIAGLAVLVIWADSHADCNVDTYGSSGR